MPKNVNSSLPPRSGDSARVPWASILRNVALVLVVLAGVWLAFNVRLPSLDTLQEDISDLGAWGIGAFILLYAIVAATPIPVTIVAVAGGMAFGLPLGTVLSMIGVLIGCYAGYWIARALGRTTVMRLLGGHAEVVEDRLANGGFYAVCTLRLMPGFPYWPVNYGSGALGVRTREFMSATTVSALPGQLSLVAVGAFISNPGVVNGVAVAVFWILVIVLTIFAFRRWRSTQKPGPSEPVNE